MPRQSITFTEAYIKGLQPKQPRDYSRSDRGLTIVVYPSGAKGSNRKVSRN